nr:hypothetical protein Iba_chr01aCG19660 [Ipomoea batatas]GMC55335.1 hypothetical protein Iba_chr01eCG6460 [Ipomoea batatas]
MATEQQNTFGILEVIQSDNNTGIFNMDLAHLNSSSNLQEFPFLGTGNVKLDVLPFFFFSRPYVSFPAIQCRVREDKKTAT